jgi:integration host factor subunit alpha
MNMTVTKAELTDMVSLQTAKDKLMVEAIIEIFFDEIRQSLSQGEDVHLSGFGNFELHDKKERPGCNPKTGERVTISARRVVTFKSGRKLKEFLNHV